MDVIHILFDTVFVTPQKCSHFQVFLHCQQGEYLPAFQALSDAGAGYGVGLPIDDIFSLKADFTLLPAADKAGDSQQSGGFTGAVTAYQRDDFSLLYVKRYVVHSADLSIVVAEIFHFQDRFSFQ